MTDKDNNRRAAAVKAADAISAIEGVPVSQYAKELSLKWERGEITGAQMKQLLLSHHKKLASQENNKQES